MAISKWERAVRLYRAMDSSATDEEVHRAAKNIFARLVVGPGRIIGRVDGKLVVEKMEEKSNG